MPFLPFFWPAEGESPTVKRMAWPWLYLSCAVAVSYVTYLDLDNLHEFYWVRLVEYLPCYALLIWAVISQLMKGVKSTRSNRKPESKILQVYLAPWAHRQRRDEQIEAANCRFSRARIADCQRRLPAHSIPPRMLAELDELDEQLAEARRRLQLAG